MQNVTDEPGRDPSIRIVPECLQRINYALQQNDVPVIARIALTNPSDRVLEDIEVTCRIEHLAEPCVLRVARVEPGATYNIERVPLALSPAALASQMERERTELRVEATIAGRPAGHAACPLEVLAFNEWAGASQIPEMLAAFITPNHTAIDGILRRASELLERSTGDGALCGYQSRSPQRAAAMAEAVYLAVQGNDLSYVSPPASFENNGQKIRSVDQILEARLGTCLDLALLLAAAWEQAGLHPLVVFTEGHAFAAVWTAEECFAQPVVEDCARVRKRVDLGEMVPVEATALTGGSPAPFAAAVQLARSKLQDDRSFRCAIDVRAARRLKIRPLPLRISAQGDMGLSAAPREAVAPEVLQGVLVDTPPPADEAERPTTPEGRVGRWKRKLLDLSLRNRLLNFRETRLSIPLLCPDVAALENALAEGGSFWVLPRPDAPSLNARDAEAQQLRDGEEAAQAFLREELADRRVRTRLTEAELSRRMTEVFRAARTSVEESGANTLYLALGMLTWYETAESQQPRHAPLILLPLQVERRSTREGFRILLTDDPPRTNVTLLEKLRTDFGMDVSRLLDLPEDASGLDIPLIFRRFRESIKDIPRWDISETAWVGLFSFSKFLMWLDLQEKTRDLLKNRVVRYLVERPDVPFSAEPFPDAGELDRVVPPGELLCPMDADSSQLVAVRAASEGRSFVLEGPPGTGKSQTITNLIAHALGQGKRVLFVAEKLAALEVVYRRLDRSGLGPYCLQLHSSKASKKEVVAQLAAAFAASGEEPRDWATARDELERKRDELNAYVDALHKPRASGESFYRVASRLVGLSTAPDVPLAIADPAAVTLQQLTEYRAAVGRFTAAAQNMDDPGGHPLRGIGRAEWNESLQDDVRHRIEGCERTARELLNAVMVALSEFAPGGIDDDVATPLTWPEIRWLAEISRLLLISPSPTEALLREPGWSELRSSLQGWIGRGRARDSAREALFARYRPALLDLDLPAVIAALRRGMQRPAVLRWFTCRAPRSQVAGVLAQGRLLENPQLLEDLERALNVKSETDALAAPGAEPLRFFGRRWNGGEADWTSLEKQLDWVGQARVLLQGIPTFSGRAEAMGSAITALAAAAGDCLASGSTARSAFERLIQTFNAHTVQRREVEAFLAVESEIAWPDDREYFPTLLGTLGRWRESLPELREWSFWRRERGAAAAAGLQPLIDAFERGGLPSDRLTDSFEKSYAQRWVRAISDSTEILRHFSGESHAQAIARFRALDRRVIELTREVLRAALGARVPRPGISNSAASEMGILQRQISLRRGHMPVRKLVRKLPNLLPRLKPCFLMSPLSVAQHLDTEFPPFDLIVFDEASQIPVWDAVGAMARGSEVIIVGDSKQLPPTNFFARIEGEEEIREEDDIEELESILEECTASGIPPLQLLWHYRSRHESLITFSNYHYYDNRLNTFPAPVDRSDRLGVSLRHFPDARYDRGGTRTNRREAEAIVEEIVSRLRAEGESPGKGSIGVVTFNAAQQSLIEDLLDEKRREFPEIERYFGESEEPVFVKNLENVQGDERDTILFSICYGPDENGRVLMNFGPLGHEGGERRLNVAITRARNQVILFSSLRAEDIDLARSRTVGVRHLKSFLEYAERGPKAISEATTLRDDARGHTPLEHSIQVALAERGWDVEMQVGCSGYRIDLAVRDPERPGEYLLGIECDGLFYSSAKTARDRDRLRQQVLESLGWRLHRVWSTEWRLSRERSLRKLEEAIREAQRSRAQPEEHPTMRTPSVSISSDPAPAAVLEIEASPPPGARVYEAFSSAERLGDADEFYSAEANRRIAAALRRIVEQESPILFRLATRRLAALYGIERITSRVEARIAEVLAGDVTRSRPKREGDVLWAANADPADYSDFRTPGEVPDARRDIDEIPEVEIASAAMAILRQQISLPTEDLVRETARLLGVQRITPRIAGIIERSLQQLANRGVRFAPGGIVTLGR